MTFGHYRYQPRHAPRRRRRVVLRELAVAAVVVMALLGVRTYAAAMYVIPSGSMEPTLHGCAGCTDDRIVVDKLSYRFSFVHRGDIVVFHATGRWALGLPPADGDVVIKRVVAVGGDTIACCDASGRVQVNGRGVDEPYLRGTTSAFAAVRVPAGSVWVMGDNRPGSSDSRERGVVATRDVIGRAVVRIWPTSRWGRLTTTRPSG